MENKKGLCEAEVRKNLVLAEIGEPLTQPLSLLNESCNFKKEWDRIQKIWHHKKVKCKYCKKEFPVSKSRHLYCSDECNRLIKEKRAKSPVWKAKMKAYNQSPKIKAYYQKPETKARIKAYQRTPEVKARMKAYRESPEVKARIKAYQKSPEDKARRKAYRESPEVKARMKAKRDSPEGKAKQKRYYIANKKRISKKAAQRYRREKEKTAQNEKNKSKSKINEEN